MNCESLMIDSGAFTVWNKGESIDLDAYISFCKEHIDVLDVIVALDVIPGKPGKKHTRENVDKSCAQGWENYKKMIKGGLPVEKVVPVFHQGDDFTWLRKYVTEGVPYIGISPANDRTSHQRQMWLDNCMPFVCNQKGMPIVKFHGFAVTSIPLILRYPWYSVDSASWLKFAIYGAILIPRLTPAGTWDYLAGSREIFFSTKSSKQKEHGKHYDNLSKNSRVCVERYLETLGVEVGVSEYRKEKKGYKADPATEGIFLRHKEHVIVEKAVVPGVRNRVEIRASVNKHFMDTVADNIVWPRPFRFLGRGLF